jgi:transaldolase
MVGGEPESRPRGNRSHGPSIGGDDEAVRVADLDIKIFVDTADLDSLSEFRFHSLCQGFTTNPTLMQRAGVTDYEHFAGELLALAGDRPVSFEVLSDDIEAIEEEALAIASWGESVYVKIPVSNARGASTGALAQRLSARGVKVNVTAVLTLAQVEQAVDSLRGGAPGLISVFAGRIADTGRDPSPLMRAAAALVRTHDNIELMWASTREILNVVQATKAGCDVVTLTPDLVAKLSMLGRDLAEMSRDTVRAFYQDGQSAGFRISSGADVPNLESLGSATLAPPISLRLHTSSARTGRDLEWIRSRGRAR